MKNTALIILLLLIGCTAFAKQHKHKKKQQPANEIISVSMHRTACFGRCPDYEVEIDKKGMATYTAIRFNPDTGVFKKNIGVKKAMEIINQFYTYRVDTCQDRYVNRIVDLPGMVLTIKYKSVTKTIQNAHCGPAFLRLLAGAIDEAGTKTDNSWKKVKVPESK